MFRFGLILSTLALLLFESTPSPACSLCGYQIQRLPFSQEWARNEIIVYGHARDSRLNTDAGLQPGSGTTEFQIEKVLKSDPALGKTREVTLNRYIPVIDPKKPPRLIAFFEVLEGRMVFRLARQVRSEAMVEYLTGAAATLGKNRVDALLYYARFLDHEDDQIADDAFLEFARSNDDEVGKAAKQLAPERFRALLKNPRLDSERISLFAFLLGSCGGAKDADFLKGMLAQSGDETLKATDGILGGYTALRPREGWDLAARILADPKKPFHQRHSLIRMVRFYHGWKPEECKKEIERCYKGIIQGGDLADFAIEDLRQWKSWSMTAEILGHWNKESHNAPIIRRAIVRYALSCPLPEAQRFVEVARRQEREMVRELQSDLEFEQRK